ncbi:tyrosine-type recombinase/integrase [candidate division KSB1 bacterium]
MHKVDTKTENKASPKLIFNINKFPLHSIALSRNPQWILKAQNCYKKSSLPSHYHFHSLRHTYATRLNKSSNNNLRLVQKQLGHGSIAITQVYADVLDEDVEQALRRLEE